MPSNVFQRVRGALLLKGDVAKHEHTDAWSNRDLIPLPPSRRTWRTFNYFGFWTLSALNISVWQSPNTYLTQGLSVAQAMGIIIVSNFVIGLFSTIIAWVGLTWHIGFTVQSRYSWGFRGSYIPLLQRVLLNFIWTAIQCWNGGRLVTVALTAIWPSFANIPNTLSSGTPTTTSEMTGFIIFWLISVPFLWLRPENFKRPFQFISIYCGFGMLSMMIWSLSVAKGVGPVFTTGQSLPASNRWNASWLIMAGINQGIGSNAAGMVNGSDFSRYARRHRDYISGTVLCLFIVGTLVAFAGLVTTAACQKIYGDIYWNPPDLLTRMMDNGQGSAGSRVAVFFLAFGFGLTSMFENICGNAIAGGIDLAGLFPRYIDIRRGAIITFVACWVVQPWQLINRAATFISVLSSFSVFLAPIMGIMTADYFFLRRQRIKLSALYQPQSSIYWFQHGFNYRAIPAWIAGFAPTIGGLIVSTNGSTNPSRLLVQLYDMAFFLGFLIAFSLFLLLNAIHPVGGLGDYDEKDVYGAFTSEESSRLGMIHIEVEGIEPTEKVTAMESISEMHARSKAAAFQKWLKGIDD